MRRTGDLPFGAGSPHHTGESRSSKAGHRPCPCAEPLASTSRSSAPGEHTYLQGRVLPHPSPPLAKSAADAYAAGLAATAIARPATAGTRQAPGPAQGPVPHRTSSGSRARAEGKGKIFAGGHGPAGVRGPGWVWHTVDVPDHMRFGTGYPSRPFAGPPGRIRSAPVSRAGPAR